MHLVRGAQRFWTVGFLELWVLQHLHDKGAFATFHSNGILIITGCVQILSIRLFLVSKILESGDNKDTISPGDWTRLWRAVIFISGRYAGYFSKSSESHRTRGNPLLEATPVTAACEVRFSVHNRRWVSLVSHYYSYFVFFMAAVRAGCNRGKYVEEMGKMGLNGQ